MIGSAATINAALELVRGRRLQPRDDHVSDEMQIECRATGTQPHIGLLLVPAAIALAGRDRRATPMNSRPADYQRSSPDPLFSPATGSSAKTAAVILATAAGARPAVNDDAAAAPANDLRNPLWIIAIGMAWFFGLAAAVMALTGT